MQPAAHWHTSDTELVAMMSAAEVTLRQAYAEVLSLASAVDSRGVAGMLGYANTDALMVHVLRITRQEARHRLAQATELFEQTTPTGAVVEVALPQTADALARGEISAGHVDVIRKTLHGLTDLMPEKRVLAEEALLGQASVDDPRALSRFSGRVRDMVDPDGPPPPPDPDPQPTQWMHKRTRRDGSMEVKALLNSETAYTLNAMMKPLEKPFIEGDTRGYAERAGDAFAEVVKMAANCPDLPTSNGFKAEVALTVSIETLRDYADDAVLPGQSYLTAREARRIACDCHVLPAVMDGDSKPLDVAVPAYVVPAHIRRALVLRDRGCAFPGCDRQANVCDSHHIWAWLRGGPTHIDNLVLLCGQHHRLIHRSEWTVKLTNGWAYFTPPTYIDPLQKPRYNTLHRLSLPSAA